MNAWRGAFLNAQILVVGCGYVSLSLAHSILQRRYARRELALERQDQEKSFFPSVDVVVPCRNESPQLLDACAESLLREATEYPGEVTVHLVDDGSENLDDLRPVYERYRKESGWRVEFLPENRGKRRAQAEAARDGEGEILLTVDSDTVVERGGLRNIVAQFRDKRVGAVAGYVQPLNVTNRLARLLVERYKLVFERERAAQSRFGCVNCCAGPFAAYRRAALEGIWDRYVQQRFLGADCISGDDLYLTILVLEQDYRVRYEPRAVALTHVPTTLRTYLRQQLRWNRSLYRELKHIVRLLPDRHRYLWLDVAARTLLPLLLGIQLGFVVTDIAVWRAHLLWSVGMAAFMVLVSAWLTRRDSSGRFVLIYGLLYVTLLLPARFWALATLRNSEWSTRKLSNGPTAELSGQQRLLRSLHGAKSGERPARALRHDGVALVEVEVEGLLHQDHGLGGP